VHFPHYNIPIFIPHLACPFTCVFCNQKHISGIQEPLHVSQVVNKIEQTLSTIDTTCSVVEVAFFGGSFTCLEIDEQKKYLQVVKPYLDSGKIKSVRLSTRPDFINDEILSFLKTMRVETIELGVQSMDNEVLSLSGRGHTAEDVVKACELIKSYGLKLGMQMMIGLPGDTKKKSLLTAKKILALKPDCVRIYPTLVIKDTVLEKLYKDRVYEALSVENAAIWTMPVLKLFIENHIDVIKVGLHPSEEFDNGYSLIAGPYHSSFRTIVMTHIWNNEFRNINETTQRDITITVPSNEYNNAIGYKAYNRNQLKDKFRRVRFLRSEVLKYIEYHVDYY